MTTTSKTKIRLSYALVIGAIILSLGALVMVRGGAERQSEVLQVFVAKASVGGGAPWIDVTEELKAALPAELGRHEADRRLGNAGFSTVDAQLSDVKGMSPPQADYYTYYYRKEHWWSTIYYYEYVVVLGFTDESLTWIKGYINRKTW